MALAGKQQVESFACRLEFFNRGLLVDLDRREGVVMHADDFVATDEVGGFDGVVHAHSEIVANAQRGELQPRGFPNQWQISKLETITAPVRLARTDASARWSSCPWEIRM